MGPKKIKLADPDILLGFDWNLCCLCQKSGSLICPKRNTSNDKSRSSGYSTLAKNLTELKSIGALPNQIDLAKLDDGDGLEYTLLSHSAKWHKSCYLKFNRQEIERAKTRLKVGTSSAEVLVLEDISQEHADSSEGSRSLRSATPFSDIKSTCFFCHKGETRNEHLLSVSTKMDEKLKYCAEILEETELIAFLSLGDLVAKEAKYHAKCHTDFYNRCRSVTRAGRQDNFAASEAIAFASVAQFIADKLRCEDTEYIFKMPILTAMYKEQLCSILSTDEAEIPDIHTSRLRDRILLHFPQLRADKSGREYVLLRDGVNVYNDVCQEDADTDAVSFFRFLKLIRKDMSQHNSSFKGTFHDGCQEESVPPSLMATMNFLLYGSSTVPVDNKATQPSLTISQLVYFNYNESIPGGNIVRHKKSKEPPIPMYIALSTYGRTRSKDNIDKLHALGLSVSPNRVTEVTATLCNLVNKRAEEEGVLCPRNLRHNTFTIGAYDNLDYNPSSVTSKDSFHGTGISLFQIPTEGKFGRVREFSANYSDADSGSRSVPDLPENYKNVRTVILSKKNPHHSQCSSEISETLILPNQIHKYWLNEKHWLNNVHRLTTLNKTDVTGMLDISWAAFHASHQHNTVEVGLCSILPLFHQESTSVSMVRHGMDIVMSTTNYLNPGQVSVMCVDQPLYALMKIIQWNWPNIYGESKFVVLFGPFHIEQAFLKVLGQLLDGSGWVSVIAHSGITTEGSARSRLKVAHVTKARAIHQITASALYSLLVDAHEKSNCNESLEQWIDLQTARCPTFKYWVTVLNLEILLLVFVRSIRLCQYEIFKKCIKTMLPWFFLLNHLNYARWLTVHIKDLEMLPSTAPTINSEFNNGKFVISKTKTLFSALAIDQAHEQNNAMLKADGGAVGLMQDPVSLRRFTVAGPEVSSLLTEFKIQTDNSLENTAVHHEQYNSFQSNFLQNCQDLKESIIQFGSPFEETSNQLMTLDTHMVMDQERVNTIMSAEERGTQLYRNFVEQRLVDGSSKKIFDPIKKSVTNVFSVVGCSTSKMSTTLKSLKSDVNLFSRLFIVARNRNLDLDEFFKFENTSYPPSLSSDNALRACQKSDIVHILEKAIELREFSGLCDTIVYDGAALIHCLLPRTSETFSEYSQQEFKGYITNDINDLKAKRVDIVWDQYYVDSLKNAVRNCRGNGKQYKVSPQSSIPKNWKEFLRNSNNKEQLFDLLGSTALCEMKFVQTVTNVGGKITSSCSENTHLNDLSCKLEEADGRILLHTRDAVIHGAKIVVIRSTDSDVVILAVSFFFLLSSLGLEELWVQFGIGNKMRYIPAHTIAISLGEERAVALRGFHSFSGCDTVSGFANYGKKSFWKAWMSFPEATQAFWKLSFPSTDEGLENTKTILETFVAVLYGGVGCADLSLTETRKVLFTTKDRPLESLPPTSAALYQHTLRSWYQGGQIWGHSCTPVPTIPSPESWGWQRRKEEWVPRWSTLPPIWEACHELVRCRCKAGCASRCSCMSAGLPCTLLCTFCRGSCTNEM